jgi:hypothetical protein
MSWVFWSIFAVACTASDPLWLTVVALTSLFAAKFLDTMEFKK